MTKQEAIDFCRANTMRRVSVLGYAQLHCPNAYQEYIDKANKHAGIAGWFDTYNHDPEHLKERFNQREKQLNELHQTSTQTT